MELVARYDNRREVPLGEVAQHFVFVELPPGIDIETPECLDGACRAEYTTTLDGQAVERFYQGLFPASYEFEQQFLRTQVAIGGGVRVEISHSRVTTTESNVSLKVTPVQLDSLAVIRSPLQAIVLLAGLALFLWAFVFLGAVVAVLLARIGGGEEVIVALAEEPSRPRERTFGWIRPLPTWVARPAIGIGLVLLNGLPWTVSWLAFMTVFYSLWATWSGRRKDQAVNST